MSDLKLWHGKSLSTFVYEFTTPVYVAADVDSEIDRLKKDLERLRAELKVGILIMSEMKRWILVTSTSARMALWAASCE